MRRPETGTREWLATAGCLIDYWWAHTGEDGVPAYDFPTTDFPTTDFSAAARAEAPRDSSAAAILAEALARLSVIDGLPDAARALTERLDPLIDGLAAKVTPQSPDDARPPGMLLEGCANAPQGAATQHELVWGDYHLYAALHCLDVGGLPC
jgi:hypothetical protein